MVNAMSTRSSTNSPVGSTLQDLVDKKVLRQ
jgi:hypothetical protein